MKTLTQIKNDTDTIRKAYSKIDGLKSLIATTQQPFSQRFHEIIERRMGYPKADFVGLKGDFIVFDVTYSYCGDGSSTNTEMYPVEFFTEPDPNKARIDYMEWKKKKNTDEESLSLQIQLKNKEDADRLEYDRLKVKYETK